MSELVKHLEQQIQVYLEQASAHICIAYSGGVDSHVLLHAVCELRERWPQHDFSAVHINHGISQNSDEWQIHCEQVCQQLGIAFYTAKLAIQLGNRESLEAVAREKRYLKIAELLPAGSIVLLAQHRDDQLETLLLQLKRGAGPKGLAAMGESSEKHSLTFVRPLLDLGKEQVLEYAAQHKLQWVEDESNQDVAIERNFLRQQIIPLLKARWPQISATASRSAFLCAEQTELLEACVDGNLGDIRTVENQLHITKLKQYSQVWQNQIVRRWLALQDIALPSKAVLSELPKVLNAAKGANPCLRWQNHQFRRFQEYLYVLPVRADKIDLEVNWGGQSPWQLPEDLGRIKIEKQPFSGAAELCLSAPAELTIKFAQLNENFKPHDQQVSKPIKQWFKQWMIPPWQRGRVPLLYAGDKLVALLLAGRIVLAKQAESQSASLYLQYQVPN